MLNDGDRAALTPCARYRPDLERDSWVRAGMAAQTAGLDFDTFQRLERWRRQLQRENAARETWRSFKPGKGVGLVPFTAWLRAWVAHEWCQTNEQTQGPC